MSHLDGNALAGPLMELLQVDVTTITGRCTGCHHVHLLARASVYTSGMGAVMRCPGCDGVQAVLVEIRGVRALTLPGVSIVDTAA